MNRFVPLALVGLGVLAVVASLGTPDAQSLVRGLGAATAAERDAAAAALVELGDDALPALREAVRSDDPAVRDRARALLELLGTGDGVGSPARRRRATALVVAALSAPDGLSRRGHYDARLRALLPESGDALADAARRAFERPGAAPLVNPELAAALGRHVSPRALQTLVDLMVRHGLTPSGALVAARELRAHDLTRVTSGHAPDLRDLDSARRRLAPLLADDVAPRRRAAAALYAALADADSVGPLLALVDDADAAVRREAACALAALPKLDARDVLLRLAEDPAPAVRVAALEGLRDEPRDAVRPLALRAATDVDAAVRAAAVPLLVDDPTADACHALSRLEVDDAPRVRGAVRRLAALRASRATDVSPATDPSAQ